MDVGGRGRRSRAGLGLFNCLTTRVLAVNFTAIHVDTSNATHPPRLHIGTIVSANPRARIMF